MMKFLRPAITICALCAPLALFGTNAADGSRTPAELGLKTVVLDAGHGGRDPGCVSRDGRSHEKNFVLKITLKLKELIEEACPDVTVLTTRGNDTFIPLIDRSRFATRNNADLFISIHINAQHKGSNANGYSIHLLGQSQDKNKDTYAFNMDVCQRENAVIYLEEDYNTNYRGLTDSDPQSAIFLNLMHAAYREQSLLFAEKVNEKLGQAGVIRRSNGIMQNNFAVLRQATMPAALLELGFITNPTDLAALRVDANLDALAKALCEAFVAYKELYDASVRIAPEVAEPKPKVEAPQQTEAPVSKPVAAEPAADKNSFPSMHEATKTDASATKAQNVSAGAGSSEVSEPAARRSGAAPSAATGPDKAKILYGTQAFASRNRLEAGDSRLLGYKPVIIPGTSILKYIIGTSESEEEARKMSAEIKKKYPDAFFVKIQDGNVSRVK